MANSLILLKRGLELKNYLSKNPLKPLGEFSAVMPAKDGSGFLAVQEIKFATAKEAEFFLKLHEFMNNLEL